MPRSKRIDLEGRIYHVINRANGKLDIFKQQIDYNEFVEIIRLGLKKFKIDLYTFCIMPTHWHLVCSPKVDGELSKFVAWISQVHAQRWHKRHASKGTGHFYQGRYKSFIINSDDYFLNVCRYVDRNPVRSGLVKRVEFWPWSGINNQKLLSDWPIKKSDNYLNYVNFPHTREELSEIRNSVIRGAPYGDKVWVENIAKDFKLDSTITPIGRPKKQKKVPDPFSCG